MKYNVNIDLWKQMQGKSMQYKLQSVAQLITEQVEIMYVTDINFIDNVSINYNIKANTCRAYQHIMYEVMLHS